MKKLLVLSAVLLLSAAPAMADNYVKGNVGYFMPATVDSDSGYGLEVAYGMPLQDVTDLPLTAEFGLGYYTAPISFSGIEAGFSFKADGDFSVIPITASVLYELPFDVSDMMFNVGAGFGLYMWKFDVTAEATNGFLTGSDTLTGDGNEFGYHLQAGADYQLNDQVALVGGLKWSSVKGEDTDIEIKLGGTTINVGAKYNF